jgi:glycosyltransferase involved in cell wall biosynthesis
MDGSAVLASNRDTRPAKKMKTKILFVIDNLQFGGGERVFAQIINGLSPEDFDISLASLPGERLYNSIKKPETGFLPVDFSRRANLALIPKLSALIRKRRIDIVHGQGSRAEFYARLAKGLARRGKYVSTIAMPVEGFDVVPVRKAIYRLLDRVSERFVDRFIVVSDSLRRMLIDQRGLPPWKVVRIYNGIETDRYRQDPEERKRVRAEFEVADNTLLIGAIGRLVWQKGFEYLIKAAPEIVRTFPNAKIVIVGEGPLLLKLRALSESLGVTNQVVFTGFRSDVRPILSAMDILAIPSLLEGFPMVTLEGMAMGKPIIATAIDGIAEQIENGQSGILVTPGDEAALTSAVIQILNNREFAQNLGSNAIRTLEKKFSVDRMIRNTSEVYQSLT